MKKVPLCNTSVYRHKISTESDVAGILQKQETSFLQKFSHWTYHCVPWAF